MVCQNKTNKTVLKENLVVSSILGVTVLSGALLTLPSVSADDVVDTITITVPTSCSISSTGENSHTAEISNGQSNSAIGETTIKAFCNDNEGFAIYAIGYTDNELGKNVLTNSTLGSTHDIVTGTAITGNTSQWAMKLSTIDSPTPQYPIIIAGSTEDTLKQSGVPDFSGFTEVPDDYARVAYRESSTDVGTSAEGSTLRTTYQAYISPTQVAGEYTGQVKYVMVHPYDATAPKKPIYMQDVTSEQLAQLMPNELDTVTLYDKRDGNDYTIANIQGAYWMTQNLRITGTVYSQDSNFSTNAQVNVCENDLTDGNTYDEARCHDSENTTNGVWYNYAAASAKTIMGSSNTTEATEDICPAGWHLPSYNTSNPAGSINSLVGMDSVKTVAFNGVTGGYYGGGSPSPNSYGYWWSSIAYNSMNRYNLSFNDSSLDTGNIGNLSLRYDGLYIRCVRQ